MDIVTAPTGNVTWKLVGYIAEGCDSCGMCGHDIRRVFIIASNTGVVKHVGSECVNHMLNADQRQRVELLDRRTTRAASQWRKKLPAPLDGETRDQYIARRVDEMDHAQAAFKATIAIDFHKYANDQLKAKEASLPPYGERFTKQWATAAEARKQVQIAAYDELHRGIEQKYKANRFDYNRPIWEVRKI